MRPYIENGWTGRWIFGRECAVGMSAFATSFPYLAKRISIAIVRTHAHTRARSHTTLAHARTWATLRS